MGRPRKFAEGSRIHIGVKYDKHLIRLFDRIAKKQGMDRNQAVDICIRAAIQNQRIPDPYFPDVDKMVEAERMKDTMQTPTPDKSNTRMYSGRKSRSHVTDGKGSKITQSL